MMHKIKSVNFSAEEKETSWLSSNLYRLMLGVTVVWFAIVMIYITKFFGWSNLFLMMPDEFGGFLAGATLPLALIWVGMAYVDRSAAFKREAKFLRAYMNQLVYPEKGDSATVKAMSEAIRFQVSELQEVTKLAMNQTTQIKKELDARVDDFASLVRVLDNYSTKSIVELTNGVKTLTKSFDGVAEKAFKTTKELSGCISEFSSVAEKLQGDINGVVNSLLPGMQEINNSAAVIQKTVEASSQQIMNASESMKSYGSASEENFNIVYEKIQAQVKCLSDATEKAISSTKAVGDTFNSVAAEIDNLIENKGRKTIEYAENIDSSIQDACRKISDHSSVFASEAEKIISQTSLVQGNLSLQGDELKSIANKVSSSMDMVNGSITMGMRDLESKSSQAMDNLNNIAKNIKNETEKMSETAERAYEKLSKATDIASEKINGLNGVITVQNDRILGIVNDMDERTAQINASMEKHSITVNEATGSFSQQFADIVATFEQQSDLLGKAAESAAEVSRTIQEQITGIGETADSVFAKMTALEEEVERRGSDVADKSNVAIDKLSEIDLAIAERMSKFEANISEVESKQKAISDNILNSAEEFDTVAEKVKQKADEAVEYVTQTIQNQVTEMQSAVDSVKSVTDTSALAIAENTEKIKNTHNEFGSEFNTLVGQMDEYAGKIAQSATDLVGQGEQINQNFNKIVEQFGHQKSEINDVFNGIVEQFGSQENKIKDVFDGIAEQFGNQETKINDMFGEIGERIQVQSTAINDNFARQREDLLDAVNLVSAQTRLGEAAVNGQYKALMEVSDTISRKMTEISEQFKQSSGNIQADASAMFEEVTQLSDKLQQTQTAMSAATQKSLDDMDKVGQLLKDCADNLHQATDIAAERISQVAEDYQKCVDSFGASSDDVGQKLTYAKDIVAEQNQKMQQISEDTRSLADYFNNLLDSASDQLIEKANVANDKIKELGEGLSSLKGQLEDAADASMQRFSNSGDSLRQAVVDMKNNAEQVYNEIKSANEVFAQQSDSLRMTASNTAEKVNETMESFGLNIDKFKDKGNEVIANTANFNNAINKQIEILDIGGKKAAAELAEIEKRYREMKVENFIKDATAMIERLETLAIDVNLIFNPEVQDKLWQKYYEGDVDVFARYLSRNMSKKQILLIKEEYEKNSEFRKIANAYMKEFQDLIDTLRSCERSEILLSVVSGADIGKIYYVIARALDKLN